MAGGRAWPEGAGFPTLLPMLSRSGFLRFVSIAVLAALLGGCGGGREPAGRTPPSAKSGGDEALHAAVRRYLADTGAPPSSRYEYARFDLNGDGARDGLVYLNGPYGHWCGDEGCALLVLKAKGGGFAPVSLIRRVRGPIHVSRTTHSGWHDLAVRVAAGPEKAEYVRLFHNGRGYDDPPPLAGQGALFYPEMDLAKFFR